MRKTAEEIRSEIEQALDVVRKGLAMHRGGVDLVDFDEVSGRVSVRLKGTCVGCPLSDMTLKMGIEDVLKSVIPEVNEVVAVGEAGSKPLQMHDA